jgi:uncharacterized protein (TIRG00374 family)
MKKSSLYQLCGGVVLAGAGLYVFLRDVSVSLLLKDLRSTPFPAVAAIAGLTLLSLWLRSLRWNLILPASPSASRRGLFGLIMIGFLVNNILPARLGEAARMLLLWKRNRFTVAESAGSVLLERIFDTLVYLSFFFVPALFLSPLRRLVPYAVPMACGAAAVLLALLFYAFLPAQSHVVGRALLRFFPLSWRNKVIVVCQELASNLDWMFSPGKCCAVIFLSVAIIACYPAMMMLLVRDGAFGVLATLFSSACAAIGAAIPLSPGYVGTLHAVLKQGLELCGMDANRAIVVATLYHAIGYLTVTAVGFYYFLRLRISFKEIGKAREELNKEEKVP